MIQIDITYMLNRLSLPWICTHICISQAASWVVLSHTTQHMRCMHINLSRSIDKSTKIMCKKRTLSWASFPLWSMSKYGQSTLSGTAVVHSYVLHWAETILQNEALTL